MALGFLYEYNLDVNEGQDESINTSRNKVERTTQIFAQ
jgi:hypothetical protein